MFAAAGYPLARIRPIYYGYDAAKFPFRGSDRPAVPGGTPPPPVVIMHGSFDRHHLGPIARRAMLDVHARRPDTVFEFVGRSTAALQAHLKSLRAAAPGIRLEATGFVPYERVAEHLSRATIGIVPYEESNGTHCAFVAKAVEYLGVGLPVVSTPLRNLSSYFRDEPRIRFSGFDGSSFASQILEWLNDPQRDDLAAAERAATRVRSQLDWQSIGARAVDFLEKTTHEFG